MSEFPKQHRYKDDEGGDWIDECARTFTPEEFRGAMKFTVGKYNRRLGKKDAELAEVTKMEDYCHRWRQYLEQNDKEASTERIEHDVAYEAMKAQRDCLSDTLRDALAWIDSDVELTLSDLLNQQAGYKEMYETVDKLRKILEVGWQSVCRDGNQNKTRQP